MTGYHSLSSVLQNMLSKTSFESTRNEMKKKMKNGINKYNIPLGRIQNTCAKTLGFFFLCDTKKGNIVDDIIQYIHTER